MATINVRKVMEEIRAEVHRLKVQQDTTGSVRCGPETESPLTYRQVAHLDLEPPKVLPSLKIKEQGYHIQDFLQYRDRQFIINAYTGILNRTPDPQGLDDWLDNLRKGRMSKTDILCCMRYSTEGRAMGVKVKGLGQARLLHSLCSAPIVGYVFKLLIGIFSLPRVLKDIQVLDARNHAHLTCYKDDLLRVQTKLNEVIDQVEYTQELLRKRKVNIERLEKMYVSFEDHFRGARQDIKQRLAVYLPYIEEIRSKTEGFLLLDVGCGRGEWLELLKERGIPGKGVDHNHVMIRKCEEYDLDVIKGDAIESLRDFASASLGAVTAFHLIEHLPFDVLVKFLDEIVRVLKPGGVAIFETPNPENIIVGASSFYLDPTHRKPLPAPTIEFLAKTRGLCEVKIKYLNPYGEEFKLKGDESELAKRFESYFYGPRDYAMIGYKG
jgi:SAM-dependent methyltransferase